MKQIKRALLSVYDKKGIDKFAQFLTDHNVEIISSGGTRNFLQEKGNHVTSALGEK